MEQLRNRFQQLKYQIFKKSDKNSTACCQFRTQKWWTDLYPQKDGNIKKPDELECEIEDPPGVIDTTLLNRIKGSLVGMALGDALGAHVEFRPNRYLVENPVENLEGGGTWGLGRGQFTDDTSMGLCLAISLISRHGFVPYDQLVRYKWWYQYGYMSSIGECFDIGAATKDSLNEFMRRQRTFSRKYRISIDDLDYLSDQRLLEKFDVHCSKTGVAGNGALMRLAPVPLFFHSRIEEAIEFSGYSGRITHGDVKAYDACRYFGALIIAVLHNFTKEELLDRNFLDKHKSWFGTTPICDEIRKIAEGSYRKKGGYDDGIRGKGYIVNALEAALWAFWSDENSFEKGVLAAVNLGDDTDTTAAIYGQLAGAYYGYDKLPKRWTSEICGHKFIVKISKWIAYEGKNWSKPPSMFAYFHPTNNVTRTLSAENISSTTMETFCSMPAQQKYFDTAPFAKKMTRITVLCPDTNPDDRRTSLSDSLVLDNIHLNSMETPNNGTTSQTGWLPFVYSSEEREPSTPASTPVLTSEVFDLSHCNAWTSADVCQWIRSLGNAYEAYIDGFKRNGIDGYRLLNLVINSDLIEFGVDSSHHRRVILDGIKQLKNRSNLSSSTTSTIRNNFYSDFDGDYVLPLCLEDSIYPTAKSCVLKPQQNKIHLKLYEQIREWIGPLPSDISIDKIELVYNADSYRMFLQQINRTERKEAQGLFQPHLDSESNPIERWKVLERLRNITQQVIHNRTVSIARVWHGCKRSIVSHLVSDGFAALGRLDNGWYGKAMYFTSSAEYATKYTNSNGCLIMCYVILLNPFPVIVDDAPHEQSSKNFRFYGRGNHLNYQCHYIPVAPVKNNILWNFRPPIDGVENALYDEFAIFQQADILPQVIVHLKPANSSSSASGDVSDGQQQDNFLSKE